MSSRFFTNSGSNTLLAKFRGIFEHNPDIERFDALIGYLRASGYFAIRPHLEAVPKIRILVGINVDAIVNEYQKKGHLFLADAGRTLHQFRENMAADIRDSRYTPEVEQGILRFAEDVATKKVELRAHPTKRLHAKIYLFIPQGFNEHKAGAVITGSSNLTAAGLGVEEANSNYEFNVLLHTFGDVKFAADEFEDLWNEGVPILPTEISAITATSHLREDLTPFELYLKLLIEYFGPAIEYDPNSETDMPEDFMRLAYQMDAVKQGFLMLHKHHGFFLADVVGLGKTIVGTLIAKKFFYHNSFPNHLSEILVVAPPTMIPAWKDAFEKFGIKTAKFESCGSLHKIRSANRFDLVIVDEAHRFRNDTADAFIEHLNDELLSKERNHPAALGKAPKLVVFSESKDTTHYLAKSLRGLGYERLLTVDSATRKDLMPTIRLNFDANVPLEEQHDDFDILISTEVLAEGVNLHRANVILNYDTPWNSTRLMQRIGRVNRIGTTADTIHVFNFFPTAKVDADIELHKKAVVKLQAFHSALGEDSQIYSTDEVVDNFGLFDSDMQEEKDEALALLMELRKFRHENPARFREIRNLPLRARCGRRDKTRATTTVTFIRNKRRDAFYHLSAEGEPVELSFVEAARIFQANAKEKSCQLHDQHHGQVTAALDRFRSDLQADAARGDVVDHQIGPNEQKSLRFLSLFLSLPMTSEEERQRIKSAQDAIRRVRFAKLHRELNKLEKSQKTTPVQPALLLEKALQILSGFPLMTIDEGRVEENRGGLSAADIQPAIILSESFTE